MICDISMVLGEGGLFDHTNPMQSKIFEWPFFGYRLFSTALGVQINVRVQINVLGGRTVKNNKHTGPNKDTGWKF